MTQLARILKIRPGEGRRAALLIGLMLFATAGLTIGSTSVDALFFARFGPQNLPYMYLALGVVNFVGMLAITALLGRVSQPRLFTLMPIAFAVVLIAERFVLGFNLPWFYPVLWLSKEVLNLLQGTFTWGIAGLLTDTRQAKRLFPLFTAGSIFGAVAGSFGTPLLVSWFRSENMLIAWAVAMVIVFLLGRAVIGQTKAAASHKRSRSHQPDFIAEMQQGFQFVRRSSLMRWWSIMAVLFSILWFSLALPFSKAATAQFPNEDVLTSFLATFNGVQTAVALLLSLFVANRLFARFGLLHMLMIFPAIYLAGFGLMTGISLGGVTAVFVALVGFKFVQMIWIQGMADTAWQAAFNVVPTQRRDQVRAFVNGVPGQAGIVLAGLILIVGEQALQPTQLYLIGLITAALTLFAAWRARRAYGGALVDALRTGQPHIFFSEEEPFGGFTQDAAAINAAIQGIANPDPAIRRVSTEILGNLTVPSATNALVKALNDHDVEVRVDALQALARAHASTALLEIAAALKDVEPDVRSQAIDTLRQLAAYPHGLTTYIQPLLDDPDPAVRARAACALVCLGPHAAAQNTLLTMARSDDADARAEALLALGEWNDAAALEPISAGLSDPIPMVRRAAAAAIHQPPAALCEPLIKALGDDDRSVREAVAAALGRIGPAALDHIVSALAKPELQVGALTALEQLPVEPAAAALRDFAQATAAQAVQYQALARAAEIDRRQSAHAGKADRFALVIDSLRDQAERLGTDALHALGLLHDRESIFVAIENLKSRDANQRANAMETLESVGEAAIVRPLVQIWESSDEAVPNSNHWLIQVMKAEDSWLRACSTLVARDSADPQVRALLEQLAQADADAFVREAAASALKGDTHMDNTLSTLSLMERILFLRHVPLFADLAPADLKRIASIATENVYADGETIVQQGEEGDEMYIIVSGDVRVLASSGGEPPREVARRSTGDAVGEMAIISREPRVATVTAAGDVRTLCLDNKQFESIIRERPETSLAIMRVLIDRLKELQAAA
jgi:HEAT repeat protein/ATP/ADP translocase